MATDIIVGDRLILRELENNSKKLIVEVIFNKDLGAIDITDIINDYYPQEIFTHFRVNKNKMILEKFYEESEHLYVFLKGGRQSGRQHFINRANEKLKKRRL